MIGRFLCWLGWHRWVWPMRNEDDGFYVNKCRGCGKRIFKDHRHKWTI